MQEEEGWSSTVSLNVNHVTIPWDEYLAHTVWIIANKKTKQFITS